MQCNTLALTATLLVVMSSGANAGQVGCKPGNAHGSAKASNCRMGWYQSAIPIVPAPAFGAALAYGSAYSPTYFSAHPYGYEPYPYPGLYAGLNAAPLGVSVLVD